METWARVGTPLGGHVSENGAVLGVAESGPGARCLGRTEAARARPKIEIGYRRRNVDSGTRVSTVR